MKKLISCAVAACSLIAMSVPALATGSLAVNKHNPIHFGIAYDRDGERRADEAAVDLCHGDCEVVAHFEHTCAALASEEGHDGGWGWGRSENLDQAKHIAIEECRKHAEHCEVRTWGCDK